MKNIFPYNSNYSSAEKSLFCFHHAGGSAAVFKRWMNLEADFETVPVELPGKGCRSGEEFCYDMNFVAKEAADSIMRFVGSSRIYLFGHSMGSAIALLVCNIIERDYGRKVEALISAGRHAPTFHYNVKYKTNMGFPALEEEIKRIGGTPNEIFKNKELLRFILKMIWNDYKLDESFSYKNEKIKSPIFVHCGNEDTDASREMMNEWCNVTEDKCEITEFNGGHFFVHELGNEYFSFLKKIVA